MLSCSLTAQICDGNLGENIFEEGDFGEGEANLVVNNPNIAPGYIYTTQMPPHDGFYTISNDLQMVDGLCDGTLYEFSADIINLLSPTQIGIKPNVSFAIDGVIQYSTGEIPVTGEWQTYGFTFETAPGQNAVTLSLINNAPGGQGNDLALDNITFRACGDEALILPEEIAHVCEESNSLLLEATVMGSLYANPSYQWQESFDGGLTWSNIAGANGTSIVHTDLSAGMYYYRYLLADGTTNLGSEKCRVRSNVKIINVLPKETLVVDTLCAGLDYVLGPETYTQTGIYNQDLLNFLGCDSLVTLDLTIVPDSGIAASIDVTRPSCSNTLDGSVVFNNIFNGYEPYTLWVDGTLLTAGTDLFDLPASEYAYHIEDRHGCFLDTIVSVQPVAPFTIDMGEDWSIELGDFINVDLMATQEIVSYLWTPDNYVDCDAGCYELDFAPPYSTDLSLFAIDGNGCTATDTIAIAVEVLRKVYIPNAFSPNMDGVNDDFMIQTAFPNVQQINYIRIFDRWGNLVFGTGVYTYTADLLFLDGVVKRYDGNVFLVR